MVCEAGDDSQQWLDGLKDEVELAAVAAAAEAKVRRFSWNDQKFSNFIKEVALFLRYEEEEEEADRDEIVKTIGGLIAYSITRAPRLERAFRGQSRRESSELLANYGVPPAICDLLFDKWGPAEQAAHKPPRHDVVDKKIDERIREMSLGIQAQMARLRIDRPSRDLSIMSNSDAWNLMINTERVTFDHTFFFPLVKLPDGFTTKAFEKNAPASTEDENDQHHPYFLEQAGILVNDAVNSGIKIQQQLCWTKHGKWLKQDNSTWNESEPDFSMITLRPGQDFVRRAEDGAEPPSSKYEVSAVFEQKKSFTPTYQMEAVDYGQRLLCVKP